MEERCDLGEPAALVEVLHDELDGLGVARVDLTGDESLDAVFASACHVGHRIEPNRACLNSGAGGFRCADVSDDLTASTGVAAGSFTP